MKELYRDELRKVLGGDGGETTENPETDGNKPHLNLVFIGQP